MIRRGKRPLALVGAGVALLAMAGVSGAVAASIPIPDIAVHAWGGVDPLRLPKNRDAPVTIHGGFRIGTRSGAHPPAVREIGFDLDRHISLATKGLPVCRPNVETQVTESCRDSIVGEGSAEVQIQLPEQEPVLASSHATVFYGSQRTVQEAGGSTAGAPGTAAPAFFIQLFLSVPAPAAAVIPVTVRPSGRGVYGYRAEARVPVIAGGAGSLVSLRLRIGKRWTYRGRRYSLLSARCGSGRFQMGDEFLFADETVTRATLLQPCRVRN